MLPSCKVSHLVCKINGENKAATSGALLLTRYNSVVLQWRQKISFASAVYFAYEHRALKINNAHFEVTSDFLTFTVTKLIMNSTIGKPEERIKNDLYKGFSSQYLHSHGSVPAISSRVSPSLIKYLLLILAHSKVYITHRLNDLMCKINQVGNACNWINIVSALLLHYGH